jgi:ferredoxin-NADP reductase
MESHSVKILKLEQLTHDVKRITLERPAGYRFEAGQATEMAINKPGWEKEKRPFTFTGLNEDPHLEFTIKTYPDRHGMTAQLNQVRPGEELIIHDVWGAITYRGEGIFVAGGAGITPFIAIFRKLHKSGETGNNKLIFSNKTAKDVILEDELQRMLGKNFIRTFTRENVAGSNFGRVNSSLLAREKTASGLYYICGPDLFVEEMQKLAIGQGATAESLVIEK